MKVTESPAETSVLKELCFLYETLVEFILLFLQQKHRNAQTKINVVGKILFDFANCMDKAFPYQYFLPQNSKAEFYIWRERHWLCE